MFQNDSDGNALMSYGTVVDITDLMKSKNEVIETSKSLLLAEEIANVGSYIRDMETDTYTCSVGFLNILGLDTPLQPLKYEDVIAFTHPDDIERVSLEIEKSLEHSDSFNFENRIIRTNGEIRYIRSKGTHIRDNSGNIVKVIGTILDITDYKENEEKLLNNLKKLEQVEQIADVGFYEYDLLTESYNLSEGFLNVCGLDSNSFIPTFETMSSTVFIGDRRLVNDTFREIYENCTTYSFDHRVMTPHNKIKHVKSIGTYIKDEAGNPIRRIGTIIDVTDYVKATDKLMDNERRLTEAEITSGTGNWEWNIETDEHYMSKGLLNILGYSSMEEIPSEWKLNAIYHKRDSHRVRMIISDAINSKKDSYSYEAVIVRPDGEPRTVSVNGILIKN
jgi:PAS domain S-box-containing protein